MPSEKTLNSKNLASLGADRLAELLLELTKDDATAKRRLRLELASLSGSGGEVAAEVAKRLSAIARTKSFADWRKVRLLAKDLEVQRAAIMAHVAEADPAEAFGLLWRLLEIAPSIYKRCDDSQRLISDVMDQALRDLAGVAGAARLGPARLADQVFAGVCANGFGQFDGLIPLIAEALGEEGLEILKARFEDLARNPPASPAGDDDEAEFGADVDDGAYQDADMRLLIDLISRGPVDPEVYERRRHARMSQTALTEIADALGDVDGYASRFSTDEHANPAIAAQIAERLLAAGRAEEAMAALAAAEAVAHDGGHWPDWHRVRIETLDSLGRSGEAQTKRWAIFERELDAEYLSAFLKRLPDFDDEEAETRALAYVRQWPNLHQALTFLIDWPAHSLAAELVLARHGELDGDHYELLAPAAEALEQRHPLAATLLLRAMIDFTLDMARAKRYVHAARHLKTCEYLAKRIEDFGGHLHHNAYELRLRALHERKKAFWYGDLV